MKPPTLSVREDLLDFDPYVAQQAPARYRLNTNESPYPPPRAAMDEIAEGFADLTLNRYPDKDATELIAAVAARTHQPEGRLWVANGSNEVLLHLFLTFGGPGRTCLTFEPTYSLHSLIARIAGTRSLRAERDEEFRVDARKAIALVRSERPDLVILCSPNNPSGNCDPVETVSSICSEAPGLVVVDEAYCEFAGVGDSVLPLLEEWPGLVVVRTLSKAWRLAGARIGYLVAREEVGRELARVRLPYHLSSLTQLIGRVALAHSDEAMESVAAIVAERERISLELQAMGVKTFPSRANFVLFEPGDAAQVFSELLSRDVLVRRYPGDKRLENCLRVTAGLPEENDAFLSAMREVLG